MGLHTPNFQLLYWRTLPTRVNCQNKIHQREKIRYTWNIRPSGEYVLAERSYPVPIEVMIVWGNVKDTQAQRKLIDASVERGNISRVTFKIWTSHFASLTGQTCRTPTNGQSCFMVTPFSLFQRKSTNWIPWNYQQKLSQTSSRLIPNGRLLLLQAAVR